MKVLFSSWLFSFCCLQGQNPIVVFNEKLEHPEVFIVLPDFENIALRDMAISPSYDELFFTLDAPKAAFRTLITSKKTNGVWSAFQVAPFSGSYHDIEPAFSADGQTLYFASKRPVHDGGQPINDYDIWRVTKTAQGWGKPERLPETINTSGDEYYPSVAANGNLYFTSERAGSVGKEDIFMSRFSNGAYHTPVSVKGAVNTVGYEYNAFVSPDEKFMVFGNYGRENSQGGGDIYISFNKNNIWQEPTPLNTLINSPQLDYCPFVTADGKFFFFTSEVSKVKSTYNSISIQGLASELNQPKNGVSKIYYIPFQQILKDVQDE